MKSRLDRGRHHLTCTPASPECAVSVVAAWSGEPGLALGNAVGSIIVDSGLIFGLGCLLSRLPADRFILNRQGWVQFGSGLLLVLVCWCVHIIAGNEAVIGRSMGFLFVVGFSAVAAPLPVVEADAARPQILLYVHLPFMLGILVLFGSSSSGPPPEAVFGDGTASCCCSLTGSTWCCRSRRERWENSPQVVPRG